jgi:hypothetical protein
MCDLVHLVNAVFMYVYILGEKLINWIELNCKVLLYLRARLDYTGLHQRVAIFIPDSAAAYTTPQ